MTAQLQKIYKKRLSNELIQAGDLRKQESI